MSNTPRLRFYDFATRVHLRRDPRQYGIIGVGPFGGLLDATGTAQFVFWEHEGSDLVTCEAIADLMSEEEYHENRNLFIATMRRDEMRLVYAALWFIKHETSYDWRALNEIETLTFDWEPTIGLHIKSVWYFCSDEYVCICHDPESETPDFEIHQRHEPGNPQCGCGFCPWVEPVGQEGV